VPETFVISKDGVITYKHIGPVSTKDLEGDHPSPDREAAAMSGFLRVAAAAVAVVLPAVAVSMEAVAAEASTGFALHESPQPVPEIQFEDGQGTTLKRIVAPDGSEIVPTSKPQPDGTLLKALARAWRWQRMLDQGLYTSISEIGDAENISKSYISRILRLALLAPAIVDVILAGRTDQGVMLEHLERPLPASWEEQRDHLGW
jgi:hypothetical protein